MTKSTAGGRKAKVSVALWIPVFWMLSTASKPISYWLGQRGVTEATLLEGNPIDRRVLSVLTILGILIVLRRVNWADCIRNNTFIVLWFLYCGLSVFWADFPAVSFKRWIKELGMLAGVLIVLTEAEPVEAVKTLLKRFSYLLVTASIFLILFVPTLGMARDPHTGVISYVGVTYTKNNLGRICLIAAFFLFCNLVALKRTKAAGRVEERSFLQWVFLAATLFLLVLARSATASGALLIGIAVFLALGTKIVRNNVQYLGAMVVIGLVVGVILQVSFDVIGLIIVSQGKDVTLSGRTELWKALLALHTNPLRGVGFGSFWLGDRLSNLWSRFPWKPNEAHNGYLGVYLELGYLGLCSLAGVLFCAYQNIKKDLAVRFQYARFRMGIFFIALLFNITEEAIGHVTLVWFVFLLVALDVSRRRAPKPAGGESALPVRVGGG